jgi:hypothetical protein
MAVPVIECDNASEASLPGEPRSGPEARRAYVTSLLPVQRCGLEIAPYFNPMIDRSRHDVFYVDCIGNDEIQRKAAANPGAVGRDIPWIDRVWVPGKRLTECVDGRRFAYAVASHVMEHVPNPLGWLHEILECVEVGGRVAIVLPMRTKTMDYYRQVEDRGGAGRPVTTLPVLLFNEYKKYAIEKKNKNPNGVVKKEIKSHQRTSSQMLEELRKLAGDRVEWRKVVDKIAGSN